MKQKNIIIAKSDSGSRNYWLEPGIPTIKKEFKDFNIELTLGDDALLNKLAIKAADIIFYDNMAHDLTEYEDINPYELQSSGFEIPKLLKGKTSIEEFVRKSREGNVSIMEETIKRAVNNSSNTSFWMLTGTTAPHNNIEPYIEAVRNNTIDGYLIAHSSIEKKDSYEIANHIRILTGDYKKTN
jgi:hypothetical protein